MEGAPVLRTAEIGTGLARISGGGARILAVVDRPRRRVHVLIVGVAGVSARHAAEQMQSEESAEEREACVEITRSTTRSALLCAIFVVPFP